MYYKILSNHICCSKILRGDITLKTDGDITLKTDMIRSVL